MASKLEKHRAKIKGEIQKLLPIRYEENEAGKFTCVMRDPRVDPNIDEVVETIINYVLAEV